MKLILTLLGILFFSLYPSEAIPQPDTKISKVFVLGEQEKEYEIMMLNYQTLLLQATKNDMVAAHDKWVSMIKEMEAYADQIDFDIKGVKIWLHVFWEGNGMISHLGFHLKPQSRNINLEEMKAFFTSFINHYQFPLTPGYRFSHYGSATFPTTPARVGDN